MSPSGFTFGRERRIRRRADFVRVQTVGERATSRHFVLLVARQLPPISARPETKQASRLGIVATKKVGDATMRNRIKRLCRECFRLWPGFVPDEIDLVVIAREGAADLTLAKVREEWSQARPSLLRRCEGVLRAPPKVAPKPDRSQPGAGAEKPAPNRAKKAKKAR